jgi:uncharacterized membrane protein YqjE
MTNGPWLGVWRAEQALGRKLERWGAGALTVLLVALGLILIVIAVRGSNRLKAVSAVWVMLP